MSIRQHIINNFKDDNHDSLQNAINESIEENDEVTLPGMGVFFEIVWQGADQELKNKILEIIEERVKSSNNNEKTDK